MTTNLLNTSKQNILNTFTMLSNRDLALVCGVLSGLFLGFYGTIVSSFTSVPVLGKAYGHGLLFKVIMIILSGGSVGNFASYLGEALDIFINKKNIIKLVFEHNTHILDTSNHTDSSLTYPKYLYNKLLGLNNRAWGILIGSLSGFALGIYGTFISSFVSIPVLGGANGHSTIFKIIVIILSGGAIANVFSYIGSGIDIFTNNRTIFSKYTQSKK